MEKQKDLASLYLNKLMCTEMNIPSSANESRGDLVSRYKQRGNRLGPAAAKAIEGGIAVSEGVHKVVIVSQSYLGVEPGSSYEKVLEEAEKKDLFPCAEDIGLRLAIHWDNQSPGKQVIIAKALLTHPFNGKYCSTFQLQRELSQSRGTCWLMTVVELRRFEPIPESFLLAFIKGRHKVDSI